MNGRKKILIVCVIFILAFSSFQITSGNAHGDANLKYLSVLRVVNQYVDFDQLSWEAAAEIKTTDSFQWFEAAIFHFNENQEASGVHLYKFDDTFDFFKWFYMTSGEWIDYRESYRLLKVDIPNGITPVERSHLISKAFMQIFEVMVKDTPSQHYGLRYSGHNSNGGLFENEIHPNDARWLFESVTALLGRKIDFLDMGGNCSEGKMNVLTNFYPYFDYMMASDLPVGGYQEDPGINYNDFNVDYQYPLIVTPDKTLKEGLTGILDLTYSRWDNSRIYMVPNKVMQSISLYDMREYETMAVLTYEALTTVNSYTGPDFDLYHYIKSLDNHEVMESQFFLLRIGYRSNKGFFEWYYDTNGLMIAIAEWVEPDFSIFPPFQPPLIRPGDKVDVDLLIRPIIAFDSPLTFEAHDLPAGITVTFSEVIGPQSLGHSPHRVTMSIMTGDMVPVGLHTFQVIAAGGDKIHTASPQISVVEDFIYFPFVMR
jgi:hypothetical protein